MTASIHRQPQIYLNLNSVVPKGFACQLARIVQYLSQWLQIEIYWNKKSMYAGDLTMTGLTDNNNEIPHREVIGSFKKWQQLHI